MKLSGCGQHNYQEIMAPRDRHLVWPYLCLQRYSEGFLKVYLIQFQFALYVPPDTIVINNPPLSPQFDIAILDGFYLKLHLFKDI